MTISFPRLADYHVVIEILLRRIFPTAKVLVPPPITAATLEKGARHSPDFVCAPFKYNLGNMIEALDAGADVLVQAGGGCRFGYYAELQEQILRDSGYEFTFITLLSNDGVGLSRIREISKQTGGESNPVKLAYALLLAIKMIKLMDGLDDYMRKNQGFETVNGSFQALKDKFLHSLYSVKTFAELRRTAARFRRAYRAVPLNKPQKRLRVGVVGELYDLMEAASNRRLEHELTQNGIEVTRFTNLTYLLFQKRKREKKTLKAASDYLKYTLGADGTETVSRAKTLAEAGYDGIIHVKPFGCTPEINALPMLMNIAEDYSIPILYLTFDSQTSETGVKTRLEAFCDMLKMNAECRMQNAE